MALQFGTVETQSSYGVTVRHSFITQQDGADRLLILLPGHGYTVDHPLLYHLREAALQIGYDVLSVQYGFQAARVDLDPANMPSVQEDMDAATAPALARGYRQVAIAGKSLGTPLAAELAKRLPGHYPSLILLTPIGGSTQGLERVRTLAIIGTADSLYIPQMVVDEPHIRWMVIDGANHSLELQNDWRKSLDVLREVIEACETFLRTGQES